MKFSKPYQPPTLTVDIVIFRLKDRKLEVLLTKRANQPFKGAWSLPGGYCAEGQTTLSALDAIVKRKVGIDLEKDLTHIEQLYTFDTVARDPRGHAVSVTYMGLCNDSPTIDDAEQESKFLSVDKLGELAYDHSEIIKYARERLIAKLNYTNAVAGLLESKFTMTQLQDAYEAVFGHKLDKRNFRKKIIKLDLIHETSEMWREGAHRPAKLYAFNKPLLESLSRSFD
ncbi:DNA mismatch repair protein MutT [Candidatus Saccharibacteria bacterium]|nr:MAG: DNA mismatch repair protein MutT [Candidatus Saccharibacteria bacterium]